MALRRCFIQRSAVPGALLVQPVERPYSNPCSAKEYSQPAPTIM